MAENPNVPDPVPPFEVVTIEIQSPGAGECAPGPSFNVTGTASGQSSFGSEWTVTCALTGGTASLSESVLGMLNANGNWTATFPNLPPQFTGALLKAELLKNNESKASNEAQNISFEANPQPDDPESPSPP